MRRVNWPILLDRAIREAAVKPFAYGVHDCAIFVADCIQAMTGIDPAADWRGTYDDAVSAQAAIYEHCGGGLDALASQLATTNGFTPVPVGFAARGDVALHMVEGEPSLAIVSMNGRELLHVAPHGLLSSPLRVATQCWRVE